MAPALATEKSIEIRAVAELVRTETLEATALMFEAAIAEVGDGPVSLSFATKLVRGLKSKNAASDIAERDRLMRDKTIEFVARAVAASCACGTKTCAAKQMAAKIMKLKSTKGADA